MCGRQRRGCSVLCASSASRSHRLRTTRKLRVQRRRSSARRLGPSAGSSGRRSGRRRRRCSRRRTGSKRSAGEKRIRRSTSSTSTTTRKSRASRAQVQTQQCPVAFTVPPPASPAPPQVVRPRLLAPAARAPLGAALTAQAGHVAVFSAASAPARGLRTRHPMKTRCCTRPSPRRRRIRSSRSSLRMTSRSGRRKSGPRG
mmetsp:Transcript_11988/g.27186  ORF Transcript_11988/g.27186 Transcript_11988/m.27186 type:complete len:200 (-) Transcript_11988:753-1352(-)